MRPVRRFPLGVQLTLPKDYRHSTDFARALALAKENDLAELELNIVDLDNADPVALKEYLWDFGFSMTRLASGAYAKARGLSLSSADDDARRKSVTHCIGLMRYAKSFSAEIILGLLKGTPGPDPSNAPERFGTSLAELIEACGSDAVPILVEATNRYESSVANTLEQASSFCCRFGGHGIEILPDTFHMNIEESDSAAALVRFKALYHSLHLSDNNRLLPGFGQLDFSRILKPLVQIEYAGSFVLEGNTRESIIEDLSKSIGFVDRLLDAVG